MTINKVCGSGLKAVALATQAIQTATRNRCSWRHESMTNAPYLLPQARKGYRLGNSQIIDSVVNDGLWDIYNKLSHGDDRRERRGEVQRDARTADEFAVNSHRKAVQAWSECRFKSQIVR